MKDPDIRRTPTGEPILVHTGETTDRTPPAPRCLEEIEGHIEKYIGKVDCVLHELVSDIVHIDVHHVPPSDNRPFHTLITTGMSDRAMKVPSGVDAPRYLELMMTLPEDWDLSESARNDERWYWPIRLLKTLARLPHQYDSWLGWGHTVPNCDPPQPYAPNTKLCGAIIAPSLLVPPAFYELQTGEQRIAFFSIVPIYKEEMELKLNRGMEALLGRLLDHDIKDVVHPDRKNVVKRFFGLL